MPHPTILNEYIVITFGLDNIQNISVIYSRHGFPSNEIDIK